MSPPSPRKRHQAAASACSRSAMMSALSSRPTDSRTTSSPRPRPCAARRVSCRCVVEAGWMIRLRVSPILARCENSLHVRDQLHAGVDSRPCRPKVNTAPAPFGQIFLRQRMIFAFGQPGIVHPGDFRPRLQATRRPRACSAQCRSMRSGSVSMPVRIRKAFIGAMAGPRSRRPSTRAAMAKAKLPKVSAMTMP